MAEQPTTEQPYTEADVKLCVQALGKSWNEGHDTDEGFVRACLDALAAAGRLPVPGAKTDLLLTDGTHWYWSTHCRHAEDPEDIRHDACSLKWAYDAEGRPFARKPAQCKTCAAPCICPCHAKGHLSVMCQEGACEGGYIACRGEPGDPPCTHTCHAPVSINEESAEPPVDLGNGDEPPPSAATIASVMAVVDAPYRPGLDVQLIDEESTDA